MNATQPFNTLNQINECPICMDVIEGVCNKVVTECGHAFHCSCLMKNASHNGFGCPYCRTAMAETPAAAEEDDEYDEEDEEESIFDEDVLTGFRMFHQRINGEEVEEEAPEEWESVAESEEEEEEEEEETMPDSVYISQKLVERGITFDDLVKSLLVAEHSNFGSHYSDYERRSSEIYGQFRAAISQYRPEQIRTVAIPEVAVTNSATNSNSAVATELAVTIPEVAEAKTVSVVRRREFMNHV